MAPLGKVKVSGRKFYQHSPLVAQTAAREFTKIAVAALVPERAHEDWHPCGIIGRFIDDSSKACLRRASGRILCIDLETGREYEQPYFRLHPNEATEEIPQQHKPPKKMAATFEESIKKAWSGAGSPDVNEYKSHWFVRSASQTGTLYRRDGEKLIRFIPHTMEMDLLTHVPVDVLLASDFELVAFNYKRQQWEVPTHKR